MKKHLTQELVEALHAASTLELEVIDPSTNHVYVIIDGEKHQRAMSALRRQEDDWAAIQDGIAQADAGQTMSLTESDRRIREQFGFAPRS